MGTPAADAGLGKRLEMTGADVVLFEEAFDCSASLFQQLHDEIPWRQEQITLFGRTHQMPRLVCWMGSKAYRYSGITHSPAPVTSAVREVMRVAEGQCGTPFNGVLCNLYRDGRDSMGWHADDEASLGDAPVIASASFGGVRRMRFKPKSHHRAESFGIELPSGSLLIMRGATQANWLHAVARTAKSVAPRINLTFRNIVGP